ncbi:MAG: transposase [Oscillospiraceae bacterium]|nr:transposase [Oscillospiraceae bacterium]
MSFAKNDSQQITLDDSCNRLTQREQKHLEKSWAKYFADYIFPNIDEERFRVLYSKKDSRPNTPVNVILGGLMLKEMFGMSDEEFMETLMFDVRFQYALHTSSYEEQPISDRTFGRFRQRCNSYETETGKDLIREAVEELSQQFAKMMKISGSVKRMDSMMVASNIKRMSRLELLYTCVSNMVQELEKASVELPETLKHYTEKDDLNKVIYHAKSENVDTRIQTVLSEAKEVKELCGSDYDKSSNYQLLLRVLREQTNQDGEGNYILKEKADHAMNSQILQNPADPDATYRSKAGKQNRGYVANIVEDVSEKNSIVTMYQFEQNTYSDSKFTKDTVEKLGKQETPVTLVADGAYGGQKNEEYAKENNIELVSTDLVGRKPKEILADFEMNEDGTSVLHCPAGYSPKSCSYNEKEEKINMSFRKEHCENCPFKDQCNPREYTRTYKVSISKKSQQRAKQFRRRQSEEFKQLSNIRNGAETVPSYLRRKYNVDRMPVRGLQKCKMYFGLKLCASNIKKFCRYMQDMIDDAMSPVMA